MQGINIERSGLIWGGWQMEPDTWVLTNGWANFCYLLIGEEQALLIDTGCGEGNIRYVAESITDKPIWVVNTHGHCDHVGGNFWWKECYCKKGAKEEFPIGAPKEQLEDYYKKLPSDFVYHYVEEGYCFRLGGRNVEVLDVSAHANSSIVLLDSTKRMLFSGDEVDPGQVLLLFQRHLATEELVSMHLDGMKKIKARESEYDKIGSVPLRL